MQIRGLEELSFQSSTTYTILEELGRGGMGIVYLAERECMGVADRVVLKTMREVLPKRIEGLRQEATIATGLRHDNIVRTFGLEAIPYSSLPWELVVDLEGPFVPRERKDESERRRVRHRTGRRPRTMSAPLSAIAEPRRAKDRFLLFMVMDFVEGVDLRGLLRAHIEAGRLLPIPLAAYIVAQICRALAHVHKHLVHRDISPDNILINDHGTPKLSDFGVAIGQVDEIGKIAGKPAYIAPECYTEGQVDERSDLFSLGMCFYYALTGLRPLVIDKDQPMASQLQQARRQIESGIPSPSRLKGDVPDVLGDIVLSMIEPDPDRRVSRAWTIADRIEQEYLFVENHAVTNNSLAAYIRYFETGFTDADTDDMGQLSFLRDASGRLKIERLLDMADYGREALLQLRPGAGGSGGERARPEPEEVFGIAPLPSSEATWSTGRFDRPVEEQVVEEPAPRPAPATKRRVRHLLRIACGERLVRTYSLGRDPITIGSDPGSRCRLAVGRVRPQHARVLVRGGEEVVVERVDPEAVIQVNRLDVARVAIKPGDRLHFGTAPAFYHAEAIPVVDRLFDLTAGDELPGPEILEGGVTALRTAQTVEAIDRLRDWIGEVYAAIAMPDRQRADLLEGVGSAIAFVSDPDSAESLEVRILPVRSRVTLEIRGRDGSTAIADLFDLLVRADHRHPGSDAEARVRRIDRIEYRDYNGALRFSTTL